MKPIPLGISLLADGRAVEIEWQDGSQSVLPLNALRAACPCALCKGHNPAESLNLTPEDFPEIQLEDVELVGRYAYRFAWSDGHDKGIYEFSALRNMGGKESPGNASY